MTTRKLTESLDSNPLAVGKPSRTRAEIDADIDALRDEAEEELREVERLQAECWREREPHHREQP